MAAVLDSAKQQVLEIARNEIAKVQKEGIRKDILAKVAEQYTREAEHNFSQYIRSLQAAEVEVNFKGKPGEAFINKAQSAVEELESYLDNQNPEGAVIQFLKKRYNEEGIKIITGRLYAGHYVNRRSQGTYEIANRMGYASNVDKRKPWLSGDKTVSGLQDLIENTAKEIFEITFEDLDLSSDMALLDFSAGSGFKSEQSSTPKPKSKPSGKKKKKK